MPKAAKVTKKVKEPKAKKVKDPNAPKKPSGAYMWFCKDRRDEIKQEHPGWGVTDIGKQLGKMWKETDDEDKKQYYAQAELDKERYSKDMETYKPE